MTAFVAWILFPAVLGLLALGCGLLVQTITGFKLPEGLHLPAGIALIIVVAEVLTKSSALAPAATPLVALLALIGFVLARPWRFQPRIAWWPLIIAAGVYLVFLAPVLFSGEPTFTGFIKLDDTATWMGMTDQVLKTGHAISSLPASTYASMQGSYLTGGEPVGSMLPWGIAHQIVGQDLAWEFQPYEAFLGAMIALTGWSIVRPLVRSPVLRGLVVFIGAQSALIYGYSLWGGIKEVAAALILLVTVACVIPVIESEARIRSFFPLAVAAFSMLGVNGYDGAVWLPVTLLGVAVLAVRFWVRQGARNQLTALGLAAIAMLVLGIHAAGVATGNTALTSSTELGNLAHAVRPLQLFGVWPATDFRVDPPNAAAITYLLIALVIVGLCVALFLAWRERWVVVPLAVGAALGGALLASLGGSPWIQGKAFATASPTLLLVGLLGVAMLVEEPARLLAASRRARVGEGFAVARGFALGACLAVAVAVVWGNALEYGHVSLAPYAQMSQLSDIGQRFPGSGPTMQNENEPYGGRHFLRLMAAESPSDIRPRPVLLRGGGEVNKGSYSDLDQFQLSTILVYRTIVMRSSPVASRPPANYHLIYHGTWYQAWQKGTGVLQRPILDHLPLGDQYNPTGVPACAQVAKLAREAGPNGLLAAPARPSPTGINVPSQLPVGNTTERFQIATPGVYVIWLGGAIVDHLVTSVDGKPIGSTHEILNEPGGYTPLGKLRLNPGIHTVVLSYSGAGLAPGSAGPGGANDAFTLGPLEISPPPGNIPVTYVSPNNYKKLCGKPWDWVEALGA